jgi:NAD dependent epimerase/dehydratase family enzyme
MFLWAIQQPTVEGVFNAVAPNPVRGVELVRATAKAMGKSAVFLPAPSLVLRLMLGEMSAVILNSNHVTASKSTNAGFQFLYPDLPKALASIFQRH